jgi:cardiolipin synthase A/B
VREFINSAQNSLLIKQFTFTEPCLIAAVIERKNPGVDVRVMLNAKVELQVLRDAREVDRG